MVHQKITAGAKVRYLECVNVTNNGQAVKALLKNDTQAQACEYSRPSVVVVFLPE